MTLEKILLTLFLKHVHQFEDVKKHLISGLKEFTLAASSSLEIVQEAAHEQNLIEKAPFLDAALTRIDTLLKYALDLFPENLAPAFDTARLKTELLKSIVAIIDEEIQSLDTESSHDEKADLQRQALVAIKAALLKRNTSPKDTSSVKTPSIAKTDKAAS
jgi:hypothetical protein